MQGHMSVLALLHAACLSEHLHAAQGASTWRLFLTHHKAACTAVALVSLTRFKPLVPCRHATRPANHAPTQGRIKAVTLATSPVSADSAPALTRGPPARASASNENAWPGRASAKAPRWPPASPPSASRVPRSASTCAQYQRRSSAWGNSRDMQETLKQCSRTAAAHIARAVQHLHLVTKSS